MDYKCVRCYGTGVADNNGDMWDYEEWPCDKCGGTGKLPGIKGAAPEWRVDTGPNLNEQ